jgi:hypothetical protein
VRYYYTMFLHFIFIAWCFPRFQWRSWRKSVHSRWKATADGTCGRRTRSWWRTSTSMCGLNHIF